MVAYNVQISGDSVGITPGSLNITEVLKQRSTCNFRIPDENSLFDFDIGEPVEILDESLNIVFAGTIDQPQWRVPSGTNAKLWEISCLDYSHLADKRHVQSATFVDQTLGEIVRFLAVAYLNGEGIDISGVQDGPTIPTFTISYETCGEAFTSLANRAADQTGVGWQWRINYSKELLFFSPDTYAAPVDLTGSNCRANSIRARWTREDYWNRVVVWNRSNDSLVISEDATEQLARIAIEGGSGIYEKTLVIDNATTIDEMQEIADAELARTKAMSLIINIDTREEGLEVGQKFTLSIAGYGTSTGESQAEGIDIEDGLEFILDEAIEGTPYDDFQYLIRSIRTYDDQGVVLWRQVEGIGGPVTRDYVEWFRELRNGSTAAVSAGSSAETLIVAYA